MIKKFNSLAVAALITLSVLSISIAPAGAQPGTSTNGVLLEEWRYDMHWYCWGYYGSSPAIADLGVNNHGSEPDSDLEIVTGSDECWGPDSSMGVWRTFDSGGNLEWQKGTQTDEARSSPVIVDLDGDGDLEIAGGTTSGWYFEVMDHQSNFVWTFPKLTGFQVGGPFVWPSSPAAADLDPGESGLELVIGNRWLGNVWAFDGDNSDGTDSGITISGSEFPWPYSLGTEGTDWDVLWKFPATGSIGEGFATPAIGDVDNDGALEVVIGAADGNVYILNGVDGSLEHTFYTGDSVHASVALANLDADACIEMIIGSTDNNVYCLQWDGTTGSTEWTFLTGGAVYSSAAVGDVDGDGSLEIVIGSNDGNVYSLSTSGSVEWSYATGGAVYSSPALADRCVGKYDMDWPMFRHDVRRTGYYGAAPLTGLDIYVGSDDCYLYLLDGSDGSMIDRFQTYSSGYCDGIHTSPSIADVDGDNKLEIFFYDWGQGSVHGGHTFWALEDTGSGPCNEPPDVSEANPSIDCLWPPNHKFVDITIEGVTDPDGDAVTITITGITSDEPTASINGAGDDAPDASGVGTDTASLRAERSGTDNGRVYEITFVASDGKGGETTGSVFVKVPHDQKGDCVSIDDGQVYDATEIN